MEWTMVKFGIPMERDGRERERRDASKEAQESFETLSLQVTTLLENFELFEHFLLPLLLQLVVARCVRGETDPERARTRYTSRSRLRQCRRRSGGFPFAPEFVLVLLLAARCRRRRRRLWILDLGRFVFVHHVPLFAFVVVSDSVIVLVIVLVVSGFLGDEFS